MVNLSEIVSAARQSDSTDYEKLINDCQHLLTREKGAMENFTVEGRLASLQAKGEAIVVGDLHGDLRSLVHVLKTSGFMEKAAGNEDVFLIFLGDYGDRGSHSPEVYYTVLKLKLLFPQETVLIRGNHEGPDDLMPVPHDLRESLKMRFGKEGTSVYSKIRNLFPSLYNGVVVDGSFVMLHGGVPSQASSVEDLEYAHLKHPGERHLEEILWSDPAESAEGTIPSPRGAGMLFGRDVTQRFLELLGVRMLIRGHEPSHKGFKIDHEGRVLTLFSRKGPPYYNSSAAYLKLDLSSKPQTCFELTPSIF